MWRLRANPRPFVLIGVGIALIVAFAVIVGPLFNTSGAPTAEIDGLLPTHAVAGHTLEMDLALDNTGTTLIPHVCIATAVRGPLRPDQLLFQGEDRASFSGGRACGGALGGGASISLRLFFTATGTGTAQLSLTPTSGTTPVGSTLSGAITVTSR